MSTLLERMQAIRAKANTDTKSDLAATPTPLWVFVEIYSKANRECYLNYMSGAKILEEWLTTPDTPLVLSEELADNSKRFPTFLCSYEFYELNKVTSRYKQNVAKLGLQEALDLKVAHEYAILHYLLTKAGYSYDPNNE